MPELNTSNFDGYCQVARQLLADLSPSIGENYAPSPELDLEIARVRAVSTAVLTIVSSLHAYHPPFPDVVKAGLVTAGPYVEPPAPTAVPPLIPSSPVTQVPEIPVPPAPPNDGSMPRPEN